MKFDHTGRVNNKKNRKMQDRISDLMRLGYYSIQTKWAYCVWIIRIVEFHQMTSRVDA